MIACLLNMHGHFLGMDLTAEFIKEIYNEANATRIANIVEYVPHTDPSWGKFILYFFHYQRSCRKYAPNANETLGHRSFCCYMECDLASYPVILSLAHVLYHGILACLHFSYSFVCHFGSSNITNDILSWA